MTGLRFLPGILGQQQGGGDPSGWDPTTYGTVHCWYDPSDTATINDTGTLVNQIDDKSGNGHHLAMTTTHRPTTNVRSQNSLNVIDFNASDQERLLSTTGPTLGANRRLTLMMVIKADTVAPVAQGLFSLTNENNIQYDYRAFVTDILGSGSAIRPTYGDGGTGAPAAGDYAARTNSSASTSPMLITMQYTSSSELVRVNGSTVSMSPGGGTCPLSDFLVSAGGSAEFLPGFGCRFAHYVQNYYFDGWMGEIVVWDSCSDIAAAEAILEAKWGL